MGGVFISYRREDSPGYARLIYERLSAKLKTTDVFFDVDNIQPGVDFVEALTKSVAACDVLVAVIGKNWTSSLDKNNQRRLEDPKDFVRIEIETALDRAVRVIPVLVEGATMPSPEDLPINIKKLARRQAIEISHTQFNSDVERLTRALSFLEAGRATREDLVKQEPQRDRRPAQGEMAETIKVAGVTGRKEKERSWSEPAGAGLAVFVAKPGADVLWEYNALTAELIRNGYRVFPDPAALLPNTAKELRELFSVSFEETVLAIHLLGERTGFRADGADRDIVLYQLDLSSDVARAWAGKQFCRLIWTPKLLPASGGRGGEPLVRDPIAVLSRFSRSGINPWDKIFAGTATEFSEFVLQNLRNVGAAASK
jgi:hypothetical protein